MVRREEVDGGGVEGGYRVEEEDRGEGVDGGGGEGGRDVGYMVEEEDRPYDLIFI